MRPDVLRRDLDVVAGELIEIGALALVELVNAHAFVRVAFETMAARGRARIGARHA